MLIDPEFNYDYIYDIDFEFLSFFNMCTRYIKRIGEGIYANVGIVFINTIFREDFEKHPHIKRGGNEWDVNANMIGNKVISDYKRAVLSSYFKYPCSGIADNVDQILKHYRRPVLTDPNRRFVIMVNFYDNTEHPWCWRWYKMGMYIGNQSPQAEYFKDEPIITNIVGFDIFEVK